MLLILSSGIARWSRVCCCGLLWASGLHGGDGGDSDSGGESGCGCNPFFFLMYIFIYFLVDFDAGLLLRGAVGDCQACRDGLPTAATRTPQPFRCGLHY